MRSPLIESGRPPARPPPLPPLPSRPSRPPSRVESNESVRSDFGVSTLRMGMTNNTHKHTIQSISDNKKHGSSGTRCLQLIAEHFTWWVRSVRNRYTYYQLMKSPATNSWHCDIYMRMENRIISRLDSTRLDGDSINIFALWLCSCSFLNTL